MAEIIPTDFILPPGRYLVQQDAPRSPLGTVVRHPMLGYGSMGSTFQLSGPMPNPAYPGDPENPVSETITVNFTRVVFQFEGSQEVNVDGEDYFIVHCDSILAFIPPE